MADYDYVLPVELIAQHPTTERTGSRLLHVDANAQLFDRQFAGLIDLLNPNDLLVFNDTRVIKARLFGQKDSGGKVEVLIERIIGSNQALAHIKASKSPKAGCRLRLADAFEVLVGERNNDLFLLTFAEPVLEQLDRHGHVPLPPYIEHADEVSDEQRYQTVYAKHPGAVAAPTAGLHFDEELLQRISKKGVSQAFVTLHVGAGTFQPVRNNDLSKHQMHSEWYNISQATVQAVNKTKEKGGRVIAVGTTSVRALEAACQEHQGKLTATSRDTALFITPGYQWHTVDAMVTNFHLPQSTLLMLVAAFIGMAPMKSAYLHAVEQRYRFFSYGDAMFLEKGQSNAV
uniref:tRNA preQ1(34) S-adenosylmethionine ribosyltransferase-isomerase QueA n=1 Tax=Orrella sp. TaxID=1921583 RepID=UPI0040473A5B